MTRTKPKPTGKRLVPLTVVTAPGGITLNDRDCGRRLDPSDRPIDRNVPFGQALPADTRPELLDQYIRDGIAVRVLVRVPTTTKES